jgi:hypothetical protein
MIETYFDRADAAAGITPTYRFIDLDDPLRYRGLHFASVLDRNIFAAKDRMEQALNAEHAQHIAEMHYGIPAGTKHSIFNEQGRRK